MRSVAAALAAVLSWRCLLVGARAAESQLRGGGSSVSLWKGLHDAAACGIRGLDPLTQAAPGS